MVAFLQMPGLPEALILEDATDAEHVQKLIAFLQMPSLPEALILQDATDAEHVQKLTVVLDIAAHAEQDQVLL